MIYNVQWGFGFIILVVSQKNGVDTVYSARGTWGNVPALLRLSGLVRKGREPERVFTLCWESSP